jgi:Holliday junction resolvasome RuvABC endonuclease subunit
VAGAFRLPDLGSDLGALLAVMEQHVETLFTRHEPTQVAYESPIKLSHDAVLTLRQTYSLGAALEYFSLRAGIPCSEVDLRRVKSVMTGDAHADKKLVVRAALRLGIALPAPKDGQKDAADAVGVVLETLRWLHPEIAGPHIAILHRLLL